MPYNSTIKLEAHFVQLLGESATEDCFHATYSGLLTEWFPTSRGYIIDHQKLGPGGKPEYIVVRHAGGQRPLLIVKLKRPSKLNTAGKQEIIDDITEYIEGRHDITHYNTIFGLGGIGLDWMVCEMKKSGQDVPTIIQPWTPDITSDTSYDDFRHIAELVACSFLVSTSE